MVMREKISSKHAGDLNSKTALHVEPISPPNNNITGEFLNTKKFPYNEYQVKCEKLEKRISEIESKFEGLKLHLSSN